MILRTLVAALVAVAVLGAVAVALPESVTRKTFPPAPPYGELSMPQFSADLDARDAAAVVPAAQSRSLLKLAAYPVPASRDSIHTTATAPEPVIATAADPMSPVTAPTPSAFVPFPAAKPESAASDPRAAVPGAVRSAARETSPPDARASPLVNINKATVDVLDHLAGAGRIGAAIAHRRPYRSVQDLVTRRVLRKAAFVRIKPLITVD